MEVKLFKQKSNYKDKKSGEEKTAINFFLQCGDSTIPIEVKYFKKDGEIDKAFVSRKQVLSAFAESIPDKE